jgi:hypothetical protein
VSHDWVKVLAIAWLMDCDRQQSNISYNQDKSKS